MDKILRVSDPKVATRYPRKRTVALDSRIVVGLRNYVYAEDSHKCEIMSARDSFKNKVHGGGKTE